MQIFLACLLLEALTSRVSGLRPNEDKSPGSASCLLPGRRHQVLLLSVATQTTLGYLVHSKVKPAIPPDVAFSTQMYSIVY